MWDNAGAQEDLYRSNRDDKMLPTTEKHLAQVGREISGNVLMGKQVCSLTPSTPFTFCCLSLTPCACDGALSCLYHHVLAVSMGKLFSNGLGVLALPVLR